MSAPLQGTSVRTRPTSYVEFGIVGSGASGKTLLWEVWTVGGAEKLGIVSWFGRWRCYAFFPDNRTVYERRCLRDIADFCESESRAKLKRKVKP